MIHGVPPGPCPLLYLWARVRDHACWALLDSGAADNFVSLRVVEAMNLTPQLLGMPMAVSFGDGGIVYTQQYVQEELWFDGFRATTYLKH